MLNEAESVVMTAREKGEAVGLSLRRVRRYERRKKGMGLRHRRMPIREKAQAYAGCHHKKEGSTTIPNVPGL